MLTVSDLKKTFNLQSLFEKINFSINPGERIGLIGPNGSGKTTLLRIIAGEEQADAGIIHKPVDLRLGYLPQGRTFDVHSSLREVIGRASGDPEVLEAELSSAANALAAMPQDETLIERYDDLLQRIQRANPARTEQILTELGLNLVDPDLPVGVLSGGQQTRLALALVLLGDPQLLLLDEPTNHLDIEMLNWLEDWLAHIASGVLIISHDRTFLDHVVTRILELDPASRSLRAYEGNYSDYLEQRRTEVRKQWDEYRDQQLEVRRMKADISRVKAQAAYTEKIMSTTRLSGREFRNSKDFYKGLAKKVAKKAKSREKRLEQYVESDERVEKPEQHKALYFEFQNTAHLGNSVLQLEELSVGFPDKLLLRDLNLQIQAGQRIVLSGANGCGKTTLLRTVAGSLAPLAGRVLLGSSVHLGTMAQDLSNLDARQTAVETLQPYFANQTETRHYLATYLLAGDEVLKPVDLLSYGQRARLELALLIARGCNLLLLDEPINHLDIPSRTQFEQALDAFEGAILAVVHDRYFIERFAQEVWLVEGQGIRRL
ncbi:ribosomal protection-like ABC-F family protein [Pelolinea submarina]|uniref:ATP-binding cassette subfamily F protein 3 n=1 Tax=Pelolinea submarina TaxID=913107 RepID=A0A347ZRI7_9CHLR|nr:ABC-F family ATP-binding cassette domain-containing protein [Pelolinea submarina]REG11525.1 ATP-binding cassette subfamily F protein 3 [Pelolinea submarina]BBB47918.1 ABC type transport system ATP-binding protein and permease [Pelolinea submarina]